MLQLHFREINPEYHSSNRHSSNRHSSNNQASFLTIRWIKISRNKLFTIYHSISLFFFNWCDCVASDAINGSSKVFPIATFCFVSHFWTSHINFTFFSLDFPIRRLLLSTLLQLPFFSFPPPLTHIVYPPCHLEYMRQRSKIFPSSLSKQPTTWKGTCKIKYDPKYAEINSMSAK